MSQENCPTRADSRQPLKIILASPRGFCAGVVRAIEIVERALDLYGPPVYVRHEIVHNHYVVEALKAKGARFVEEVDQIPPGAITVFSAHGVAGGVEADADERGLVVIDATCPLVAKVHKEGQRYTARGLEVVLIGHAGHPEVEGTLGQIPGRVHLVSTVEDVGAIDATDPDKLAYVTQTTLSVDDTREVIAALKARFPNIVGPNVKDICYATQNRQSAVRALADRVELLLVVGARNSSNSNRLREIGDALGVPSHLIQDAAAIDLAWLDGAAAIGITAGASAPEELVADVVARLATLRPIEVETVEAARENVRFNLPPQLAEGNASDDKEQVRPSVR